MNVELISYTELGEKACGVAAKTCTSSDMPSMDDDNSKALMHALSSGHDSIAEHMTFTFAIEGISRACSHQLVRHRMASYSQQSQRYVNMEQFDFVIPESIKNADPNHLVRVTPYCQFHANLHRVYCELMFRIEDVYREFVALGIPEEDARYMLPNACCTNIVVTMNARELRHFFSLRCCERAQWEIKKLADMMLALVKEVAPTLFEDAGARCKQLGYCPEKKGCGKAKKKEVRE